jgi:hypothetical protein
MQPRNSHAKSASKNKSPLTAIVELDGAAVGAGARTSAQITAVTAAEAAIA